MDRTRLNWIVTFAAVILTACTQTKQLPTTFFDALRGADRIDIKTPTAFVRTEFEVWRIKKVVDRLSTFQTGWQRPFHGAPVPELILTFMKGENTLGQLGLGHGFVTQGESQFWSHPLPENDRNEILNALTLKEHVPSAVTSAPPVATRQP